MNVATALECPPVTVFLFAPPRSVSAPLRPSGLLPAEQCVFRHDLLRSRFAVVGIRPLPRLVTPDAPHRLAQFALKSLVIIRNPALDGCPVSFLAIADSLFYGLTPCSSEVPQFNAPSVWVKFIRSQVAKLRTAGLWTLAFQMSRAGKVQAEQMATEPRRLVYLARSSAATVALLRCLTRTTRPTVVWSQWSGYLKKGGPVPRFCNERGMESKIIHSGGHVHLEDLADLVARIKPGVVVSIHTEAALKFAAIMANVRILNDGDAAEVATLLS